jgi:hypothetical protein
VGIQAASGSGSKPLSLDNDMMGAISCTGGGAESQASGLLQSSAHDCAISERTACAEHRTSIDQDIEGVARVALQLYSDSLAMDGWPDESGRSLKETAAAAEGVPVAIRSFVSLCDQVVSCGRRSGAEDMLPSVGVIALSTVLHFSCVHVAAPGNQCIRPMRG